MFKRAVTAPLVPFIMTAQAYKRWKHTKIFRRATTAQGEERLYEFVLVPIKDDVYSLHINRLIGKETIVLAERTITHAEFELIRPNLQEF